MPVFFDLPEGRKAALTLVSEQVSELETMLHPCSEVRPVSGGQRLGHIASTVLLQQLAASVQHPRAWVIRSVEGLPEIPGYSGSVSVSHTEGLAAAVIGPQSRQGTDVEKPSEKLLKIASRVFNQTELEWAANDLVRLCRLWCAKEAVYKFAGIKGLAFREGIAITLPDSVTTKPGKALYGNGLQTHIWESEYQGFCMAVVVV